MILVTGGSGLLGKELISQLLADGKEVKALYNNSPIENTESDRLTAVRCDILDVAGLEEAMTGVDQVFHCAGIVSFNPKKKNLVYQVNIEGTANVVNASLDAGVKKLVFVSSVAALGRIREGYLVNETMNWSEETSNSSYGRAKFLAEMEVWRGIAEGLPAVIVNPSIILGAGDWNIGSSGIFKNAYEEFPWYTEGESGFVDVRDTAKAMIMLMESEISGERFILSATNSAFKEVFERMASAFGKKPPQKKVTPSIANLVWRWEALKSKFTGKEPLLTRETSKTAQAKVNYDNSKLIKFFPAFRYRSLEETINDTCAELKRKFNLN